MPLPHFLDRSSTPGHKDITIFNLVIQKRNAKPSFVFFSPTLRTEAHSDGVFPEVDFPILINPLRKIRGEGDGALSHADNDKKMKHCVTSHGNVAVITMPF